MWRWKLCELQYRKSISISGINLIVWRGYLEEHAHLEQVRGGIPYSGETLSALHWSGSFQLQLRTTSSRGGRRTKDCSQTGFFGFQFRLGPGKHFSDGHKLSFYYLKIGFLQYLRISGEIRYPNGPMGHWNNVTIWKEACIVHVGAVVHDYEREGAIWSRKYQSLKDCPGVWAQFSTDNVNFCRRSQPYQREFFFGFLVCLASRPSGPGRVCSNLLKKIQQNLNLCLAHPPSRSNCTFFCLLV